MDRADRHPQRHDGDQPLHLPPVTEAHRIAPVTIAVRAVPRFRTRFVAERRQQVGCVANGTAVGDVKDWQGASTPEAQRKSPRFKPRAGTPTQAGTAADGGKRPRPPLSHVSRFDTLASRSGTWQGGAMAQRSSSGGGGILIALGPIIGAAAGFLVGEATPGFLIGLAAGIALAIAAWARGRR